MGGRRNGWGTTAPVGSVVPASGFSEARMGPRDSLDRSRHRVFVREPRERLRLWPRIEFHDRGLPLGHAWPVEPVPSLTSYRPQVLDVSRATARPAPRSRAGDSAGEEVPPGGVRLPLIQSAYRLSFQAAECRMTRKSMSHEPAPMIDHPHHGCPGRIRAKKIIQGTVSTSAVSGARRFIRAAAFRPLSQSAFRVASSHGHCSRSRRLVTELNLNRASRVVNVPWPASAPGENQFSLSSDIAAHWQAPHGWRSMRCARRR
jgi:hypothetical protein